MLEFPGDNKERWSGASPARTLRFGPAVPAARRGAALRCWGRRGAAAMGKATESSWVPVCSKGTEEGISCSRCGVTQWGCRLCPGCPHCQPSYAGLTTSSHLQRCVATDTACRGRCQTTARDGQGTNARRVGRNEVPSASKTCCRPSHSAAELGEVLCPSCLPPPPRPSWGWDNSPQGSVPSPGSVTQVTQRWIRVGFRAGGAQHPAMHGGTTQQRWLGTRRSWGRRQGWDTAELGMRSRQRATTCWRMGSRTPPLLLPLQRGRSARQRAVLPHRPAEIQFQMRALLGN